MFRLYMNCLLIQVSISKPNALVYQTITFKLGFYTLEIWVHCHSVKCFSLNTLNTNKIDYQPVYYLVQTSTLWPWFNLVNSLATHNVYCYVIPQYQKRPLGLPQPENGLFQMYHETFAQSSAIYPGRIEKKCFCVVVP